MAPSSSPSPAQAVVSGLAPPSLWTHFASLSEIPRPSKQEGRVLAWLKSFADARSLPYTQDAVGNLVIRRPGTGGGAQAPPVILQGHVDMVTEKNADKTHDFTSDPLTLVLGSDGWLRADGTTLGADNGIGVAAAVRRGGEGRVCASGEAHRAAVLGRRGRARAAPRSISKPRPPHFSLHSLSIFTARRPRHAPGRPQTAPAK